MHKKGKRVLLIAVLSFCICFLNAESADYEVAGSVEDPLVTKSYVDKKVSEILDNFSQNTSIPISNNEDKDKRQETSKIELSEEISKEIDALLQLRLDEMLIDNNKESDTSREINNVYEPIGPILAGTMIVGSQGTEIILRGGKASAVGNGVDGLQDMTDGIDIVHGEPIPLYHLLIVPRSDGRGLLIQEDAWLMIRGNYDIQ